METLTIKIQNPKAKKPIDDLIELELIALISPSWNQLWDKLNATLPQSEPDINEADIMSEVKAYRQSNKS